MNELFLEKLQELLLNAGYSISDEGQITKPKHIAVVTVEEYNENTKQAELFIECDYSGAIFEKPYKFKPLMKNTKVTDIETPQQLVDQIDLAFKELQSIYDTRINIVADYLDAMDVGPGAPENLQNVECDLVTERLGERNPWYNKFINLLKIKAYASGHDGRVHWEASMSFFYEPVLNQIAQYGLVELRGSSDEDFIKPARSITQSFLTNGELRKLIDDEMDELINSAIEIAEEAHDYD